MQKCPDYRGVSTVIVQVEYSYNPM